MFTINQTGLTPGKLGYSRSDGLGNGQQVTLNYPGPGTGVFSFLWIPDDDTTAASSFSQIGNTATFTPDTNSVGGTYRIKIVVTYNGQVSQEIRLFSIRMAMSGLRPPALNERASSEASLINKGADIIAASEFNEPSNGRFKNGNYGGWYSSFVELVRKVEELSGP